MKKTAKKASLSPVIQLKVRAQETYELQAEACMKHEELQAEIAMKQIELLADFSKMKQGLIEQGVSPDGSRSSHDNDLRDITKQTELLQKVLSSNASLAREVKSLPLRHKTQDMLTGAGYDTLLKLVCLTEKEFMNIPGIGRGDQVNEVKRVLAVLHFHFRAE